MRGSNRFDLPALNHTLSRGVRDGKANPSRFPNIPPQAKTSFWRGSNARNIMSCTSLTDFFWSRRGQAVGFLILAVAAGCGGSKDDMRTEGERRLQTLTQMFSRYAATHKGATPADEAALKAFINSIPGPEKDALKIANVDDLFISPRDQKPFKVKYGLKSSGGVPGASGANSGAPPNITVGPGGDVPGQGQSPIVAYEQEGQNGRRYVAFVTGEVREVSAEEARNLKFD